MWFYFENETIKHQLLLEGKKLGGYNDDIDQVKLLIENVKLCIMKNHVGN
jgi:hypothetical protein